MKRSVIFFVIFFLVVLQGCVVYQKNSLSLENAIYQGKVKVIDHRGNSAIFTNIEQVQGVYYGRKGQIRVRLEPNNISEIYLKNHAKSKRRTLGWSIGLGVPVLLFVTAIIVAFAFCC